MEGIKENNLVWRNLLFLFAVGASNGHRPSSVPVKYRWSIWWNTAAWNSWSLYNFTPHNCCYLFIEVGKVYWKLCYAFNISCVLPLHETIISPKVWALFFASLILWLECSFLMQSHGHLITLLIRLNNKAILFYLRNKDLSFVFGGILTFDLWITHCFDIFQVLISNHHIDWFNWPLVFRLVNN